MKKLISNSLQPQTVPQDIKLEDAPCPHGCNDGDTRLFDASDRIYHLPGYFTIVRCNCCGLIRTNPRPTLETIGIYYPSHYGPFVGLKITSASASPGFIRRSIKRIIDFRSEATPKLTPGKVLEIGCASGGFLFKLAFQGWDVTGVEFSATAAAAAQRNGFKIYQGALENIVFSDETFDLIVGWMVLEHLHQPISVLKKLHDAAAPGASLVLSTPNCAGGFERFGADWFPLQVPTHLFHFTQDTLQKLLLVSGWEIRRCMQQRVLIDLPLSLALLMQSRNFLPWLSKIILTLPNTKAGLIFNLLCYPFAWILATLGRGSRMTIWAKRID